MKSTYRILTGILSAVLTLTAVGCGSAGGKINSDNGWSQTADTASAQDTSATPNDPVLSLSDVPTEHRPEVSVPEARNIHGVSMSATYSVPNGVLLSIQMLNGAEQGSLTLSREVIFEKYEAGAWVPMAGQEEIDQRTTMDESHFLTPMEMHTAMPQFPEAGVYRCVVLCGGAMTAEHYAYFEVPRYTLTEPTAEECPAVDAEGALLTVTAKDVTPNGLTLVLSPKSGEKTSVSYGAPYFISCHIDGEWVPLSGNSAFIAILYVTDIEGEHELKCGFGESISPLGAGHYRYEKVFGGFTYYVYFEIED